jgi:guanylate kinase
MVKPMDLGTVFDIRAPIAFPVVVSAPSGAGKTSLCRAVVERDPQCLYSVSVTSRQRLISEADGRDYTFVTRQAFEEGIRQHRFVEWTEYRGSYYGTPREFLERAFKDGRTVLLDLDVIGARTMKAAYPGCVTVYVLAPSLKELEKRLRGRGRDSEEEIGGRLNDASAEMNHIQEYDYTFVNEDFQASVQRLHSIIDAERYRVKRRLSPRMEAMIERNTPCARVKNKTLRGEDAL